MLARSYCDSCAASDAPDPHCPECGAPADTQTTEIRYDPENPLSLLGLAANAPGGAKLSEVDEFVDADLIETIREHLKSTPEFGSTLGLSPQALMDRFGASSLTDLWDKVQQIPTNPVGRGMLAQEPPGAEAEREAAAKTLWERAKSLAKYKL